MSKLSKFTAYANTTHVLVFSGSQTDPHKIKEDLIRVLIKSNDKIEMAREFKLRPRF